MTEQEGVIKFDAVHTTGDQDAAANAPERLADLISWRDILARLSLVGSDPGRYGGLGFGNVSARLPPWGAGPGRRRFVITGTQTGKIRMLEPSHFATVDRWDLAKNRVWSRGRIKPSSESLTHAAIYDQSSAIRWVFHVHSPMLWLAACRGGLGHVPTTAPNVPYGTLAMAHEIGRLWRDSTLAEARILAMAGHEDGLIAFGKSPSSAANALISRLAKATAGEVLRQSAELTWHTRRR